MKAHDVVDAISIHAPHTEGDQRRKRVKPDFWDFNPRPPYGGRLLLPSRCALPLQISIHAPHTEGDAAPLFPAVHTYNFNPRPPYGGRPQSFMNFFRHSDKNHTKSTK